MAASNGAYLTRPGVETLNPFITETEQESYQYWSNRSGNERQAVDDFYARAVKIFHEEGVMLVAGTDAGIFTNIPGHSLHKELGFYVEAGLSSYEALRTATSNAAFALGQENRIGKVADGYIADLIILDSSPLDDIAALGALSGVVVKGRWYDDTAIGALRAEAATTSYERTERRVIDGLAAQGTEL